MLILIPGHYGAHKTEEAQGEPYFAKTKEVQSYYGKTPKVVHGADIKGHEGKFDWAIVQSKPKDWEFMVQSGKVLKNPPPTWMSYPDTPEGMVGINASTCGGG